MRVWAILLSATLAGCTHLFFQPMMPHVRTPADLGLAHEEVWLRSADGVRLHAWFLPAQAMASGQTQGEAPTDSPGASPVASPEMAPGKARGSVLFLHGNAENISTHIGAVSGLPARGYNVLLLDYRGYGRSGGTPSVAGALLDIDAAAAHLLARPDRDTRGIVVFGQSLGGALATLYVAQSPHRASIRGLVIDSAFSDFRGIAREKLGSRWFLWPLSVPLSWTISDAFKPLDAIARIAPIPVFIMHGEADSIVPPAHARALYGAAREPNRLRIYAGAGHIGALSKPEARADFLDFLNDPARMPKDGDAPAVRNP